MKTLFLLLMAAALIACRAEKAGTETAGQSQPAPGVKVQLPPNMNDPIRITEPAGDSVVSHRTIIRGTVKVAQVKPVVWVVVRPMRGNAYWVQPRVDVDSDGKWSVEAYIGRDEQSNKGEHFKIMALANPHKELHEQDKLQDWPEAELQSKIVEVAKDQ